MLEPKNKIRAVFDVILTGSGVGLGLNNELKEEINLKNYSKPEINDIESQELEAGNISPGIIEEPKKDDLDGLMSHIVDGDVNADAKHGMEDMMSMTADPIVELASVGAEVFNISKKFKARSANIKYYGLNIERQELGDDFYDNIIQKIREPVSSKVVLAISNYKPKPELKIKPLSPLVEAEVNYEIKPKVDNKKETVINFYTDKDIKAKALNFHVSSKKTKAGRWLLLLILGGLVSYGLVAKNQISSGGLSAFNNLQKAEASLKNLDFSTAAQDFGKSYQDFPR